MTDLQVKYQTLQHEKEKLAEDKRLHDAQIGKLKQEVDTSKSQKLTYDAQTQKYLSEAKLTQKDLDWYDTLAVAEAANKWMSGIGSGLGGIGKAAGALFI